MRSSLCSLVVLAGLVWSVGAARAQAPAVAPASGKAPAAATAPDEEEEMPSLDELYERGKAMFDQLAPPEVKEHFDFPSKQQWDEFAGRLQHALESEDIGELAPLEPEARDALAALRLFPEYSDYADWLQERLDYIEAAKQVAAVGSQPIPPAIEPTRPTKPGEVPAVKPPPNARPGRAIPHYDLWLARMTARPVPARAEELMPVLRAAFVAEGVPAELAWLAEVESTLNPMARSPAGAKGLFQLMPATAKSLGLSTFLPDERTDVGKSARAAARYLRRLHGMFGDWPLALAAYNAGEGRVRRTLAQRGAKTFAEIASVLPSETRMYVPKVCATVAVRAGVPPEKLAAPGALADESGLAVPVRAARGRGYGVSM